MPDAAFKLARAVGDIPVDNVVALLREELAAVLVRSAIPAAACDEIARRFWSSQGRIPRRDGVAGHFLGAYHYGKSYAEYRTDIEASSRYIDDLFQGIESPVEMVLTALRDAAASMSLVFRRATWHGEPAAAARALAWTAEGDYLLAPHDDVGQLSQDQQRGFEIQTVAAHTVVAVNIYPKVPVGGGSLRFWNVLPDEGIRRLLGIEQTGYPYPERELHACQHFDVPVETGSVVLANGGLIHAVRGYRSDTARAGGRLLINFFFGVTSDSALVYWV